MIAAMERLRVNIQQQLVRRDQPDQVNKQIDDYNDDVESRNCAPLHLVVAGVDARIGAVKRIDTR